MLWMKLVLVLWKDTICGNSYKGNHLIVVVCLQFRGFIHYHHGRKQNGMQAGMVLEKELRGLTSWFIGNRKWSETLDVTWAYTMPQSLPPLWNTSSNENIPTPTPRKPHLLIGPPLFKAFSFKPPQINFSQYSEVLETKSLVKKKKNL